MTVIEMAQAPEKTLREIAIKRIVANAVILASDPEWDKWRAYEVAKDGIRGFNFPADEYEEAIKLLTEALKI
jgi:hypothetical protein